MVRSDRIVHISRYISRHLKTVIIAGNPEELKCLLRTEWDQCNNKRHTLTSIKAAFKQFLQSQVTKALPISLGVRLLGLFTMRAPPLSRHRISKAIFIVLKRLESRYRRSTSQKNFRKWVRWSFFSTQSGLNGCWDDWEGQGTKTRLGLGLERSGFKIGLSTG